MPKFFYIITAFIYNFFLLYLIVPSQRLDYELMVALTISHSILLEKTKVLVRNPPPQYLPYLELVEIMKKQNNFNRQPGMQIPDLKSIKKNIIR